MRQLGQRDQQRLFMRLAWGWIAASAAAGALAALAGPSQLLLGSGPEGIGMLRYGLAASLATLAGAGAVAGAMLALPGAVRKRWLHPSFGLWLMLLFGNVDWLGNAEGALRWLLQGTLLITVLWGAFRLRGADWRPGAVAAAVLVAITLAPILTLLWRDAAVAAKEQWWFADSELASQLVAQAPALRETESVNPDIYLVVPDRYPSPLEARRRDHPYPAPALAALRERGWRIRNEASTDMPRTSLTMASTFALTTRLTNGEREKRGPVEAKALLESKQLQFGRSFTKPLLLDFFERAGYDTWGWIGWWLLTEYVPFGHVDKSRNEQLITALHMVTLDAWLSIHSGGRKRTPDPWRNRALSTQRNCQELVDQRERFFAFQRPHRQRGKPLFVLYHVFWLHDTVNMNASGACQGHDEANAFVLPAEMDHGRLALCRASKERGEELSGWAPSCLPDEVRVKRVGTMIAYLPTFLTRLEQHAREVAHGRPFRILVLADEGLADAHWGTDALPGQWRDDRWIKHPAVFRATFAEGLHKLWPEQAIPDMPQAMREVVLDLLREKTF